MVFGSGVDDVVSAMNTLVGTTVAAVGGVSAKNTVCSAGVDGFFVTFAVLAGWLDVVGFFLLGMFK